MKMETKSLFTAQSNFSTGFSVLPGKHPTQNDNKIR